MKMTCTDCKVTSSNKEFTTLLSNGFCMCCENYSPTAFVHPLDRQAVSA